MNQSQIETVDYYLIFTKTKLRHWVFRFIDPVFQHVYAMHKSEGGCFWTVVDPIRSHLRIYTLLVDDYPHPRCYCGPDAVILPVTVSIHDDNVSGGFGPVTCVTVIKSLLGLRDWRIVTPYQLYKYIRRLSHGE